jgi:hypothetical protein
MSIEKYMLYIVCPLIISNPFHLTIKLNQNELWVFKCCDADSKIFLLVIRIVK